LANLRSNLFYFDLFACSNAILLAAGFYDRVHISPFNFKKWRSPLPKINRQKAPAKARIVDAPLMACLLSQTFATAFASFACKGIKSFLLRAYANTSIAKRAYTPWLLK
jgi:hypothetical protein